MKNLTASNDSLPTMPGEFDVVIRGGTVIDGSGAEPFEADIGIRHDRIVAIKPHLAAPRRLELDASGLVVAPGFIDAHTHDDAMLIERPAMLPKLHQGVTAVVTGNCGISLAPLIPANDVPPPLDLLGGTSSFRYRSFGDYLEAVHRAGPAVNYLPLVGHMTLRTLARVDMDHPADERERLEMRWNLITALREGAAGFSTGLAYRPSRGVDRQELDVLLTDLKPYDALYCTHIRDESEGVVQAITEALDLARANGVSMVLSHHKCAGLRAWGLSRQTLELIDAAAPIQALALDAYPYTASSTVLDPKKVDAARAVIVTWAAGYNNLAGRDLDEIAAEWQCTRRMAAERIGQGGAIYHNMDDADVSRILAHRLTMIGSDGLPHDEWPHPRLWGTFPRVLGHYVRERGLFSLPAAIHKMTGLPARVFGLESRGELRPGNFADLCIFDASCVRDNATYQAPTLPPTGIEHVFVNGVLSLRHGKPTGARNGCRLHRTGRAQAPLNRGGDAA